MNVEKQRAEALRLACQQHGPWTRGRLDKHQRAIIATALLYYVFIEEGAGPAMEVARNRVSSPPVLSLVPATREV